MAGVRPWSGWRRSIPERLGRWRANSRTVSAPVPCLLFTFQAATFVPRSHPDPSAVLPALWIDRRRRHLHVSRIVVVLGTVLAAFLSYLLIPHGDHHLCL